MTKELKVALQSLRDAGIPQSGIELLLKAIEADRVDIKEKVVLCVAKYISVPMCKELEKEINKI